MMEKVSTAFITGFIVNGCFKTFAKREKETVGVSIPNLWLIGKARADNHGVLCLAATETCNIIATNVVYYLRKMFTEHDVDCTYELLDDRINCAHMIFTITCKKKVIKRMTVSEIEKALGYPIEIISEDNK